MSLNVVIIGLSIVVGTLCAPSPLKVTVDCGSGENQSNQFKSAEIDTKPNYDSHSFCGLIHNAIPKFVEDGKFQNEKKVADQSGFSNTPVGETMPPPRGFIPKLDFPKPKFSRIKPSRINIPKLKPQGSLRAPKVGSPMVFTLKRRLNEETSAERMERFKKGVHRMLHVVKVMGQLDQYLSERTRFFVDKLSKTLLE